MYDRRKFSRIFAALALVSPASTFAEPAFEHDPAQRALIVVDARVHRKSLLAAQESPIIAGTLRVRTPGVRKPPDVPARAVGDVLVFAVEPGRYRPGSVTARTPKMQVGTGTVDLEIPLPKDSLRAMEHTVKAGAVVYVGRIEITTIPRAFRYNEYRFVLAKDPDRERDVWERLLAKGNPGAWEQVIQSHLDAMTALSDSMGSTGDTLVPYAADSTR